MRMATTTTVPLGHALSHIRMDETTAVGTNSTHDAHAAQNSQCGAHRSSHRAEVNGVAPVVLRIVRVAATTRGRDLNGSNARSELADHGPRLWTQASHAANLWLKAHPAGEATMVTGLSGHYG
jgi:hypothetical protein